MHYYIYEIKNKINGKIYVGVHKTDTLEDGYMGSGRLITRAIKKYGIENFTKTILEEFNTQEEMFSREKELVNEEFLSREDVYNLTLGGLGGFDYINKNDQIQKNRSEKMKGSGNHFYGKCHTDDSIKKIADSASKQWKGIPKSEEHKQRIASSLIGKPLSEERRKKISQSKLGKPAHNKGKPAPILTCPHCNKSGGNSNMTRWHFDKCKVKR